MKRDVVTTLLVVFICASAMHTVAGEEPVPKAERASSTKPGAVPDDIRNMTNPEYLRQLARVHLNFGALDRARELLRKAEKNVEDHRQKRLLRRAMAELYQRKSDRASVIELSEGAYAEAKGLDRRNAAPWQPLEDYWGRFLV